MGEERNKLDYIHVCFVYTKCMYIIIVCLITGFSSPGEGMEKWVWEEVGHSPGAVLEPGQDHSEGLVKHVLLWLETEFICLQHQVCGEETPLASVHFLVQGLFGELLWKGGREGGEERGREGGREGRRGGGREGGEKRGREGGRERKGEGREGGREREGKGGEGREEGRRVGGRERGWEGWREGGEWEGEREGGRDGREGGEWEGEREGGRDGREGGRERRGRGK